MGNPLEIIVDAVPTSIRAGDTLLFTRSDLVTDYDPDYYTLTYQAVRQSSAGELVTFNASKDTDGFYRVNVPAGTTADWASGLYDWQEVAVRNSDQATVTTCVGQWEVHAALGLAGDNRSHAQRTLDAIEAVIEGRATSDHESYSIAGRSVTRIPIAELLTLRGRYRSEVNRERRAAMGKGVTKRRLVTF